MEHLPFACLAPHGWLTTPLLSGEETLKATATHAALADLACRMEAARPETIVVVTPHGLMAEGLVTLLDTPTVRGDTADLPWAEGSRHGFRLEFEVDRDLNATLAEAAKKRDVPAARLVNHATWVPLPLDFGSYIPLFHLGATFNPRPKVVVACADRGERGLPFEASYRLGQAIREAAEETGRRVALLCSGDLGHAHDPDGPYGYDPISREFDEALVAAIRADDLERVRTFDVEWVKQAKTDAYGPIMTLLGATEGTDLHAEFLSYEVPAYFGMACAAWEAGRAVGE